MHGIAFIVTHRLVFKWVKRSRLEPPPSVDKINPSNLFPAAHAQFRVIGRILTCYRSIANYP